MLWSFRFHPHYLSFVPTLGFRSLTYSNGLDPQKILCSYELSGGICNDSHCHCQHFKSIVLSGSPFPLFDIIIANTSKDTDIIKDLTSAMLGEVPSSQQDETRSELRRLLKEVGDRSANDFQSLALTVVHLRNSRYESNAHFVALP